MTPSRRQAAFFVSGHGMRVFARFACKKYAPNAGKAGFTQDGLRPWRFYNL
ncbi:MAG: hypothetical protein RR857_15965 [Comamonas sp.]